VSTTYNEITKPSVTRQQLIRSRNRSSALSERLERAERRAICRQPLEDASHGATRNFMYDGVIAIMTAAKRSRIMGVLFGTHALPINFRVRKRPLDRRRLDYGGSL
jgi:hypothetical protein